METPHRLGSMQPGEWERLQVHASRFEAAWHAADPRVRSLDLGEFLPPADDPMRAAVLRELVQIDLEARWRRGQAVTLEQYLEKYPELGDADTLPVALVYEEFRVRQAHGDRPPLEAYRERFPAQFAEIERLAREQTPAPGPALTDATSVHRDNLPTLDERVRSGVLSAAGGYKLVKCIGAGSFGEVWRAEAPGGVEVAVKIVKRPLNHEIGQREQQALELIKNLRHPFLLQTQAYWSLEDRLLIVMELADGSLRDRLEECQREGKTSIPADELLGYFREAAEALDFLAARKVYHRDIKPDNVLLLQRHAKLADFGLARLQMTQSLATATSTGTPAYMAPEVWQGKVSPHSDQYSLAFTYAELRLGRRVFPGRDLYTVMMDHMQHMPDLAPLEEREQAVLRRAMAKAAPERFPSCKAFVAALEQAVAPEEPTAVLPRPASWARRLLTGAALVAVLAAAAVAAVIYWPKPPAQTVVEPSPVSWLPAGAAKAADAEIVEDASHGRYYSRIIKVKAGEEVPFRLIPKLNDGDPNTFYMMETKVWNSLFAAAWKDPAYQAHWKSLFDEAWNDPKYRKEVLGTVAEQRREFMRGEEWKAGGAKGADNLKAEDHPRLPVFRVTVTQAYCFATWLDGNLPTVQQWDRAAGRFDGEAGPFRPGCGKDGVAVGRATAGPMEVGKAPCDVSVHGCRDMAGNGQEWTRSLNQLQAIEAVPVRHPTGGLNVVLRGQSYADSRGPFTFEQRGKAAYYDFADPFTSFRVVLESTPGR